MGKNIFIGIIIILIIYVLIKISLPPKEGVVLDVNKEIKKSKPLIKIDNHKTKTDSKKAIDKPLSSNKLNDLNHDNYYYGKAIDCGFLQDSFDEEQDLISSQILKDEDLEKLNDLAQQCQKWFARLQDLPVEKLKQLEADVKKKDRLLTKLVKYKHDKDTLELARKEIFNDDLDIKFNSLGYLLKFDLGFQKQVAEEMNVSHIGYLTTDGITLNSLYLCQHGYDCSSKSLLMEMFCELEESSCGMSFPAWLRSGQVTLNLYDDMMRAIRAIDKILNSDWFLDHPLDM